MPENASKLAIGLAPRWSKRQPGNMHVISTGGAQPASDAAGCGSSAAAPAVAEDGAAPEIQWILANVHGPRVLDVGEHDRHLVLHLRATGCDVVELALGTGASTDGRGAEGRPTKRAVLTVDIGPLKENIPPSSFDTVILRDALGADPAAKLLDVEGLLKPGGRLLLIARSAHALDSGVNDGFLTADLIELLCSRFALDQMGILGGSCRVVGHRPSANGIDQLHAPSARALLLSTEEAALAARRELHNRLLELRRQVAELERQQAAGAREIEKFVQRSNRLAGKTQMLTSKIRGLESRLDRQKRVATTAQARMHQAQIRLKQQQQGLRQELGRAVEKSLRSPLGVFRLPLRIVKAYRRDRPRPEQLACSTAPEEPQEKFASHKLDRTRPKKVAICICTCNRPQMLEDVLMALREAELGPLHPKSVDVVVVDNDPSRKTETVCQEAGRKLPFPLHYVIEHRRGIAHARNCAVSEALARGADFIAFIDDDDRPETDWLKLLLQKQSETEAEIVGGSWRMSESATIPRWLQATPMARRLSKSGGTSSYGMPSGLATGNVLIARSILERLAGQGPVFAPEFALIGGGDNDFFVRALKAGASFAMAEDSYIIRGYEESRMTLRGMTKRAFRIGSADTVLAKKHVSRKRVKRRLNRAIKRLCIRVSTLPIVVFSPEKFGQTLWEVCYHAGALHSFLGGRYEYYRKGRQPQPQLIRTHGGGRRALGE